MSDINHDQLSEFQNRLKEAQRTRPVVYSLQEVVAKSMALIEQALKHGVGWEEIAQMLQESAGSKKLSSQTMKRYYFALRKEQNSSESSKRRSSSPSSRSSKKTPPIESAPLNDALPAKSAEDNLGTDGEESSRLDDVIDLTTASRTSDQRRSRFNFNTVR